jgi:hypothetical protein
MAEGSDLKTGRTSGTDIALLATRALPSERTSEAIDALEALDPLLAKRPNWARRTRRRNLHDHLSVLRLHLLLPRHKARDLAVEVLLHGAELETRTSSSAADKQHDSAAAPPHSSFTYDSNINNVQEEEQGDQPS